MDLGFVLQILVFGLSLGALYAIIGIGLNLLWGTMRLLNICHGDIIMLGGYITYWLLTLFGISPLFSVIISPICCAAVGLLIYKILFSRDLKKTKSLKSLEANSLLIFFGVLIIIENTALLLWGADLRGYSYLTNSVSILDIPLAMNRLLASTIAILICLAFYLFLNRTLFGKAVQAIVQDKEATEIVGVNTKRIYLFCFCAAYGMAGMAGTLISMFYTITPFIGLSYSMMAFMVVVLGGLGNFLGSLVGGFIIGLVTTAGVALTSPGYMFIIQYLLFITIILFMPQGIFGKILK
jgi:branched-chain amino acid transport system permease protein